MSEITRMEGRMKHRRELRTSMANAITQDRARRPRIKTKWNAQRLRAQLGRKQFMRAVSESEVQKGYGPENHTMWLLVHKRLGPLMTLCSGHRPIEDARAEHRGVSFQARNFRYDLAGGDK